MKEIFRKCSLTLYCIKRYHYKLHQSDRSIYFITAKKTSYKQLKINYKPSEIIQKLYLQCIDLLHTFFVSLLLLLSLPT